MKAYSVQILLPPDQDTAIRQLVEQLGSTWSPWGGHITLVSRFTTMLSVEAMEEMIASAAAHVSPFQLELDQIVVEENRNEQGGFFVMLTPYQISDSLAILRKRLVASFEGHIMYVFPDVAQEEFQPHVSLSLGLPLAEANALKNKFEAEAIIVQFTVTRITLLSFDEASIKTNYILL
jgi:2'-5' RNA ligase